MLTSLSLAGPPAFMDIGSRHREVRRAPGPMNTGIGRSWVSLSRPSLVSLSVVIGRVFSSGSLPQYRATCESNSVRASGGPECVSCAPTDWYPAFHRRQARHVVGQKMFRPGLRGPGSQDGGWWSYTVLVPLFWKPTLRQLQPAMGPNCKINDDSRGLQSRFQGGRCEVTAIPLLYQPGLLLGSHLLLAMCYSNGCLRSVGYSKVARAGAPSLLAPTGRPAE
ncbi:hypothetical protein FZEAL_5382 [Fusarium zealandicum]|uniref:Uncharacterized protein n=1 Tax=Fusarium zealandicum TaxID=1053134 RepID=A0A8H4XKX1_9HYPO|nr:hypothetical protein FZEAL_5382 [Fusarium zealandicum]